MSHDSTTMMIRRRVRNWKTTVSGIAAIVCPVISLFLPPEWAAKLLAASGILAGSGLITAADATASEGKEAVKVVDKFKTRIGRLPLPLLAAVLSVGAAGWLICGCSTFRSLQTETAPDGTVRQTEIRARTFWDAKSDLAKLRASTTDKVQGMTIGSIGQESSGTNATALIESVVRAAVGAAIKP